MFGRTSKELKKFNVTSNILDITFPLNLSTCHEANLLIFNLLIFPIGTVSKVKAMTKLFTRHKTAAIYYPMPET